MSKHDSVRSRSLGSLVTALVAALGITMLAAVPTADAQRRPAASGPASAQTASEDVPGVVNIQTASVQELERLPGIGPSKAAAIVAQRDSRAFRRIEDLMRVRGIGRATFRRLRPMLTVSGPTTLVERPRPARRAAAEPEDAELESD